MGKGSAVKAGRAYVEIFGDDSKLVRSLRAASKRVKKFAANVGAVGAKIAAVGGTMMAPFAASLGIFTSVGDKLNKMASRTGVSVEALSQLQYAADQSGTNIEALGSALFRMNRRVANAATGTGPAVRALKALGINAKEFSKLKADEQFKVLADRLNAVGDKGKAAQYGFEILGDSFKQLVPLMEGGSAGIEAFMKRADEMGLTISTETAQAAADFGDAIGTLKDQFKVMAVHIGAALGPSLTKLADRFKSVAATVIKWIKDNQEVIFTAFKVAAAVIAVGTALMGIATVAAGLGFVLGGIASLFSAIGVAIAIVVKVIAIIASPIGLVVGLMAALAYGLMQIPAVAKFVGENLTWLGNQFSALFGRLKEVFGGIVDAIKGGEFKLAFKILWLGIKGEWIRGVNFLTEKWLAFKDSFLILAGEIKFKMIEIIGPDMWFDIQEGWSRAINFFRSAWVKFVSFFSDIWNQAVGFLAKGIVRIMKLFDSDIDVELVDNALDDMQAKKMRDSDKARRDDLKQIEAERKTQKEKIKADRARGLGGVREDIDKANSDRAAANAAEIEANNKRLRDTVGELGKARKQAAKAAADAAQPDLAPVKDENKGPAIDINIPAVKAAIGKTTSGVFSAAAIRSLSGVGGDVQTKILAKAEEQRKVLLKIDEHMVQGGNFV